MTRPQNQRAYGTRDVAQFETRLAELRSTLPPLVQAPAFLAYTDGACFGNPEGPGGWAAAVEAIADEGSTREQWLLFGHLTSTSNNRAEALGVLAALEWVASGVTLTIRSDSELTVRILQGRYKARANTDIWDLIRRTMSDKRLTVVPEWVRGHAGDPGNELADRLSKLGALNKRLDGELPDLAVTTQREPGPQSELSDLKPQGEWEREFVRSVGRQLRARRPLSPKQQGIVDRIRARGAGGSEASSG